MIDTRTGRTARVPLERKPAAACPPELKAAQGGKGVRTPRNGYPMPRTTAPVFTLGVEEEYLLVDANTLALRADTAPLTAEALPGVDTEIGTAQRLLAHARGDLTEVARMLVEETTWPTDPPLRRDEVAA
jgi:hypothetical protein